MNYMRRVYSMPRENVVRADTLRDYLKFYRGATCVHACKNEVIIERYCSILTTADPTHMYLTLCANTFCHSTSVSMNNEL